jgi:cupin 2 domain-containing protein
MTQVRRGRLLPATEAPQDGEHSEVLARFGGAVVEYILSGRISSPVDYDQPHDEWVAVLDGAAVLQVDGERVALSGGDWILLPAHVPHRVVEAEPGTRWLALHGSG